MQIKIDEEKCIGCGTCPLLAPGAFKMNDEGKAEVLAEITDDEDTAKNAMSACPVEAISVE